MIVTGLIIAGFVTFGLGMIAAFAYLCFACFRGSRRKKRLISELNAFLGKLSSSAANPAQPQANPFEAMLQATGIDLS
jgi:hypothetical protein